MTKQRKIYFILALVIGVTGYLLFKPSMWQDRMETYLNHQLNEIGWHVEINEFSGHLFSTLHSNNISMKHNNCIHGDNAGSIWGFRYYLIPEDCSID